jgi:putative membrane protein
MINYSGMGSPFFFGFGFIFPLLIMGGIIYFTYWVIKSSKKINHTPLEILKKRLAKGEITTKEYHKLKKEIEN